MRIFELVLSTGLGTIPTITEIGMAALLPESWSIGQGCAVGSGKLGLEIDWQRD